MTPFHASKNQNSTLPSGSRKASGWFPCYPCVLKWPAEPVINSEIMEAKSKAKTFSYKPQICHN